MRMHHDYSLAFEIVWTRKMGVVVVQLSKHWQLQLEIVGSINSFLVTTIFSCPFPFFT